MCTIPTDEGSPALEDDYEAYEIREDGVVVHGHYMEHVSRSYGYFLYSPRTDDTDNSWLFGPDGNVYSYDGYVDYSYGFL